MAINVEEGLKRGAGGAGFGTVVGGWPYGTAIGAGLGLLSGLGTSTGPGDYGISRPGEFQQYSTGPGYVPPTFDPYAGVKTFGQGQAGGGNLVRAPVGMDQTSPGYGEQWFYQNQGRWMQPGAAQAAYNPQQFQQPGAAEQYWNGVQGNNNRQQLGETVFAQAQNMGPGMSQGVAQYGQQQLMGPGMAQQYAQQNQPGQPTASMNVNAQAQAGLGGPSMSQQYALQNAGDFQGPTASQAYFQTATQQMQNQPRNAQSVFDQFQAGPSGLDPYYAHASEQAAEDINRALAAQGLLGSSYGGESVSDAMKGLRAEQANREGDFYLRQMGLAGQLAQSADQGGLDFYRTGGMLAQGADSAALAKSLGGAQVAGQADQAQLARMGLLGNLAGQSDQQRLAYLMAGGQLAQMGSQEQMARLGMMGDLAGQNDQYALAQMGLMGDLAGQVDQTRINADLGYGNLALGVQGQGLDRANMGFQQGMALDQFGLDQANNGMQAALAAQQAYQGRGQQQFENQFAMSNALAAQAQAAYEAQLQADQQYMDAALAAESGLMMQALMNSQRGQQQNEQGILGMIGGLSDLKSAGGVKGLFSGIF